MWTCPKCGEKIEDQFDSCWKCAAQPEQTKTRAHAPHRLRRLFLCGILLEVVFIALCFFLSESWLQIKLYNLFVLTYFPFVWFMETFRFFGDSLLLGILGLLAWLLLMGLFWAVLLDCALRLINWGMARFKISKRQKLLMGYGFGLLCIVALVWVVVAETPIPFTASPEVKSTVDGNTAFAIDLYQKLKEQPGNLFFSPYSISTALAMTYAGARGQTENEMAKALHFNLAQTNLPAAFSTLGARMNQIQRWNRITLTTANSLWGQQDYRFTDAYLNLVSTSFRAEVRQIDFKHSAPAASDEINKWVEKKTDGKIKDMVEPSQFTDYTRLVLCNAIYFKGKWLQPFKVDDTKPTPFAVFTKQTVTVPMMFQHSEFKMTPSEDDTVELLELPYSGNDLSMIVLLPTPMQELFDVQHNDLSDLEQKLTAENLHAWLAKLDQRSPHKTSVGLPRFTTTQSFDLTKELKSLGMPSAFDDTADFSGMDGTTNLYISDVLHKAFVEVNEAGTEAAASTLLAVATKSMSDRFIADHPFIFLIRDNGSGTILFLGRIVDPTK